MIPPAKTSRSGTASQSAVSPNAIVPARLVQATESPQFSASGIAGKLATSRAPAR